MRINTSHLCQCACHPSNTDNPTVLCRPIFKKKKKKNKKKTKSAANVNITAGHWVVKTSNGTSFQTKVAPICGQHDGCSRLCSGCVSKWERNMKVEDPVHFQLYSSQKASCKTSAFVVCCYVNPQFALHVRAALIHVHVPLAILHAQLQ